MDDAARNRIDLGKPPFDQPDSRAEAALAGRLVEDALAVDSDWNRVNVALKAAGSEHRDALLARARQLPALPAADASEPESPRRPGRTLPMTVLFYEGPIARAYLATLAAEGARPERIVELVSAADLADRRPVGNWLPAGMRMAYRARRQKQQMHHWPRIIARRHPDLHCQIANAVAGTLSIDETILRDAANLAPLESYTDNVIRLTYERLSDATLNALVRSLSPVVMLFTGGGIVPRSLLEVPGARFIHIHPGHLPEIRGADGTLWSMLVAGRPSASGFYMAPGIDTGDVIETRWLPPVGLGPLDAALPLKTVYRAVYSFLDPWVRAALLRGLVRRHDRFDEMPAAPQNLRSGDTYRFMAPALQRLAFERLFGGMPG